MKYVWMGFYKEKKHCVICDEYTTRTKKNEHGSTCGSRKCTVNYHNGYGREEIIPPNEVHTEYIKSLIEFNFNGYDACYNMRGRLRSFDYLSQNVRGAFYKTNKIPSEVRLCYDTINNESFVVRGNTTDFANYLNDIGIVNESERCELLEAWASDCVAKCLHCGIPFLYSWSGIPLVYDNKFCKREHYEEYRLLNPDIYYTQSDENNKKASERMIKKIANGWSPPITNSWTQSSMISVGGIKFKSAWESLYYRLHPSLVYEKLRIPYHNTNDNRVRNYLPDFSCDDKMVVIEVKPNSDMNDRPENKDKQRAAIPWCETNGYTYKHISEDWFAENIHLLEELENLHEREHKAIKQFKKHRERCKN